MFQLCNALPNAFLPTVAGSHLVVRGLSETEATELLSVHGFESHVGHESFAQILSSRTGLEVPASRTFAQSPMQGGASAIVAAVQPPRRLAEGEVWGEAEILTMPISWVLVMDGTAAIREADVRF